MIQEEDRQSKIDAVLGGRGRGKLSSSDRSGMGSGWARNNKAGNLILRLKKEKKKRKKQW